MSDEAKDYREIPLTKGYVALVDAEDYERVSEHKWQLTKEGEYLSVRCCYKGVRLRLNRFVMEVDSGRVQSRNGDALDCRKDNLYVPRESRRCYTCGELFTRPLSRLDRGRKPFCKQSCARIYDSQTFIGQLNLYLNGCKDKTRRRGFTAELIRYFTEHKGSDCAYPSCNVQVSKSSSNKFNLCTVHAIKFTRSRHANRKRYAKRNKELQGVHV